MAEEIKTVEAEEEEISVEELADLLKSKGLDIRSLAKEAKLLKKAIANGEFDENSNTKTTTVKKKSTPAAPEFSLELAMYPDFCIKRKTKTQERLLVIMPSVNAYYIKNLKNDEVVPITADEYSKFTSQMPDEGIKLPDKFWINKIFKSKTFWENLWNIIKDPNVIEVIKAGITDPIDGISVNERGYWSSGNQKRKIMEFVEPYKINKKLFKEYFDKRNANGELMKSAKLVRNMHRQSLIPDIIDTFGIDNARDFLNEIDISLVSDVSRDSYYNGRTSLGDYDNKSGYGYIDELGKYTPHKKEDGMPTDLHPYSTRPRINMEYKAFKEYVLYTSVRMGYASSMRNFFQSWRDTLRMQKDIYGYVKEKYPKDLPIAHNVLSYKSILHKQQIDIEKFKRTSRTCQLYEVNMNGYKFTTPRVKEDMIDEATQQANCLASYVDRYANGSSWIFFMRKKDTPEESYITIEVNEVPDSENPGEKTLKINQRYLAHNQRPDEKDIEITDKWLKRIINRYKKNNYPSKYDDPQNLEEEEKELEEAVEEMAS